MVRRFNVRIPLRDAITLSADLTLPPALPAPAVVVRTPYGKTGERQSKRAAVLARAGYAAVTAVPSRWPGRGGGHRVDGGAGLVLR